MVLQCPLRPSNNLTLLAGDAPTSCLTSGWLCCLTSAGRALPSAAMSAKAISEQTGKEFLYKHISASAGVQNRFRYANVTPETDWDCLTREHPWLLTEVSLSLNDTQTARHCSGAQNRIYRRREWWRSHSLDFFRICRYPDRFLHTAWVLLKWQVTLLLVETLLRVWYWHKGRRLWSVDSTVSILTWHYVIYTSNVTLMPDLYFIDIAAAIAASGTVAVSSAGNKAKKHCIKSNCFFFSFFLEYFFSIQ